MDTDPSIRPTELRLPPRPISSLHHEMLERARQTAEDGAGGLQIASRRATAPMLRRVFAEQSVALGTATQQLATALMTLGKRPDEGASMRARFDRALLTVRAHLPRSDARLLEQCMRMERAVESNAAAAVSLPWPQPARDALIDALSTARRCVAELDTIDRDAFTS